MTFRSWYEEVKQQPYTEMTMQEKNALEWKFLDYLRGGGKSGPDMMPSADQHLSTADGKSSVA